MYPGGNQQDKTKIGFDWINNYWCDLTNETTINNVVNPARPVALIAVILLCISLLVFFMLFAQNHIQDRRNRLVFQVSASLSMLFALLIFTPLHNSMILLASIFGLVVVIGIIAHIFKSDIGLFKWFGVVCLCLLVVNNYIYYTKNGIEMLPLLQKIMFGCILLFIVIVHFVMNKKRIING